MTDSPCIGCEKRRVGCHADCKDYAQWREDNEKIKKTRADAKSRDNMIDSYSVDAVRKMRRKKWK